MAESETRVVSVPRVGGPEVLQVEGRELPVPGPGQVRVVGAQELPVHRLHPLARPHHGQAIGVVLPVAAREEVEGAGGEPVLAALDGGQGLAALALTPCRGGNVPDIHLERRGKPVIDTAQDFAEVVRVRVEVRHPADHPRAGQRVRGFRGEVRIEEWRTDIYDGAKGATRLPVRVPLQDGRAELTLRSTAAFTTIEERRAPIPEIAAFRRGKHTRLQIPQWVDANDDQRIDWLAVQVNRILASARNSGVPEVRRVARATEAWRQSWRRDCGGVTPDTPRVIRIGAACLNERGVNAHRTNLNHELTATVLHEARHVWVHQNPDAAALPRVFHQGRTQAGRCAVGSRGQCVTGYVFDGRFMWAHEEDAETFAQRYKHLFP